jgi:hypothetical protein
MSPELANLFLNPQQAEAGIPPEPDPLPTPFHDRTTDPIYIGMMAYYGNLGMGRVVEEH